MFLQVILPIILCFVPVIIGAVVFSRFKIKVIHLLIAILLGLVAVFPISLIQNLIEQTRVFQKFLTTPVFFYFIKSLLIYGLLEELLKAGFVALNPHKELTILQKVLLAGLLGLSLSGFENVVYFMNFFSDAKNKGAELLYSQIFLRFFTANIIHLCCTMLSGMFIITLRDKSLRRRWGLLIIAILLHGFYDFFAGFQNSLLNWFQIPVILLAVLEVRIKYKSLTLPEA